MEEQTIDKTTIAALISLGVSVIGFTMMVVCAFTTIPWGWFVLFCIMCVGGLMAFVALATDTDDEPEPKETGVETILKYTHCSSCGAPLKSDTCEYCRSKYPVYRKIRSCENDIYNSKDYIN